MAKNVIYCRVMIPKVEDESYQAFGDLQFSPNGGVRLGPTFFAYGTPIHRHRFGANLVALRSIDEPKLLTVETPFGGSFQFLYRPLFRTWYQLVEVEDPRLYFHQERYGTQIAILFYYIRWGMRWAFIKSLHVLVFVLGFFLLALIGSLF
jgi:hypothetical protein